ncbi:unnamed protein product, partial [Prorocentrum cordatum]
MAAFFSQGYRVQAASSTKAEKEEQQEPQEAEAGHPAFAVPPLVKNTFIHDFGTGAEEVPIHAARRCHSEPPLRTPATGAGGPAAELEPEGAPANGIVSALHMMEVEKTANGVLEVAFQQLAHLSPEEIAGALYLAARRLRRPQLEAASALLLQPLLLRLQRMLHVCQQYPAVLAECSDAELTNSLWGLARLYPGAASGVAGWVEGSLSRQEMLNISLSLSRLRVPPHEMRALVDSVAACLAMRDDQVNQLDLFQWDQDTRHTPSAPRSGLPEARVRSAGAAVVPAEFDAGAGVPVSFHGQPDSRAIVGHGPDFGCTGVCSIPAVQPAPQQQSRLGPALELARAHRPAPAGPLLAVGSAQHPRRLESWAHRPSQVELCGWSRPGMQGYVAWQNGLLSPEAMAAERFVEIPALHQTAIFRRAAVEEVLRASGGAYRDGPLARPRGAGAPDDEGAVFGDALDVPVDMWWWLSFFHCGKRCGKVPGPPLFGWRQHPRQHTRTHGRLSIENLRRIKVHFLLRPGGPCSSPQCQRIVVVSVGATLRSWVRAGGARPEVLPPGRRLRGGVEAEQRGRGLPAPPAPAGRGRGGAGDVAALGLRQRDGAQARGGAGARLWRPGHLRGLSPAGAGGAPPRMAPPLGGRLPGASPGAQPTKAAPLKAARRRGAAAAAGERG